MSNGKVKFVIDGIERSLYFGMVAVQIFAEKSYNVASKGITANDVKTLAYLVHSGLCNQADLLDDAYPTFEQSYELTEKIILAGGDIQERIYSTWMDSNPVKEMIDRLPKEENNGDTVKKKETVKKQVTKTGTK